MVQGVDLSIHKLLDDPQQSKELRDSFRALEIIKELSATRPGVRPYDVIKVFYEDKTDNILHDEKRNEFLKTKKSRISRMISSLLRMDLVEEMDPSTRLDKRNKLYRLTKKGETLLQDEEFRIKLERKKIEQQVQEKIDPKEYMDQFKRKFHSDSIRTLLKRIRIELEQVFIKEVYPNEMNYPFILLKLERFPFEEDVLYDDLACHLSTFMGFERFKRLLGKFKVAGKDYIKLESMLESIVKLELERELGLSLYENDRAMNGYTMDLVYWIITGLNLLDQQRIDSYDRYYKNFKFDIETYHIEQRRVKHIKVNGVKAIVLLHIEDHSKYLNKLKGLIDQITDTPLAKDYTTFKSLEEQIQKIRAEIIVSLSKEIEIPIYPGTCQYLFPDKK